MPKRVLDLPYIKSIKTIKYKKSFFQSKKKEEEKVKELIEKINKIISDVNNAFKTLVYDIHGNEINTTITNSLHSIIKDSSVDHHLFFKELDDTRGEFHTKFAEKLMPFYDSFMDYLNSITNNPKLSLKEIEKQMGKYLWSKGEKEIFNKINFAIRPKVLSKTCVDKHKKILKNSIEKMGEKIDDKLTKVQTRLIGKFNEFVNEKKKNKSNFQKKNYENMQHCLSTIDTIIKNKRGKMTNVDLKVFRDAFGGYRGRATANDKTVNTMNTINIDTDDNTKRTILTLINLEIDKEGVFFWTYLESYIFPSTKSSS